MEYCFRMELSSLLSNFTHIGRLEWFIFTYWPSENPFRGKNLYSSRMEEYISKRYRRSYSCHVWKVSGVCHRKRQTPSVLTNIHHKKIYGKILLLCYLILFNYLLSIVYFYNILYYIKILLNILFERNSFRIFVNYILDISVEFKK